MNFLNVITYGQELWVETEKTLIIEADKELRRDAELLIGLWGGASNGPWKLHWGAVEMETASRTRDLVLGVSAQTKWQRKKEFSCLLTVFESTGGLAGHKKNYEKKIYIHLKNSSFSTAAN